MADNAGVKVRKLDLEELAPVLLACSGIVGIGPMAVFRLLEGSLLVAAVDGVAVLGVFAIIWMVFVKRSVRVASILMALVAVLATVATIVIRGGNQIIWLHPTLVAVFYLLRPKEGAVLSMLTIAAVLPTVFSNGTGGEIAIALASIIVTMCLSIAFAVMTGEQRRALEVITRRDALTGIGNRRALEEKLDSAIGSVSDGAQPFFLIMLDLDHFKAINDRYGHAAGDAVLREIAETIGANIRPTDACFRTGGEEFVVVANTPDLTRARQLGERLRESIETAQTGLPAGTRVTVTASLGLAEYQPGESRDALCKRADDAMYQAKREGRNRLQLSERLVQLGAA